MNFKEIYFKNYVPVIRLTQKINKDNFTILPQKQITTILHGPCRIKSDLYCFIILVYEAVIMTKEPKIGTSSARIVDWGANPHFLKLRTITTQFNKRPTPFQTAKSISETRQMRQSYKNNSVNLTQKNVSSTQQNRQFIKKKRLFNTKPSG